MIDPLNDRQRYIAILEQDPDNVEALQFLAIIYAEEENFPESYRCLERAISLAPDSIALRLSLANILKAQYKLDEAEDTLLQVIAIEPRSAAAWNNLGTIYFARSDWKRAIAAYQQAIDIQPDYPDAYYNLGLALIRNRQLDRAMHVYEGLIALVPDHAGAQFQRACILMQQGKYAEAAGCFTEIEKTFPHHFETQTNLAACCLRIGAIERSKSHYLKAIELVEDDVQSLFNLGVISMQQGRIKEAVDYYQRCLQIDPDYFEAHNNLGASYLVLKDRDASIRHFREACRLQPDDEALKHTLDILTGNQSMSTSNAYIQSLFDSYADHYDKHVLDTLHYQVPDVMSEMLQRYQLKNDLSVLDLGCGTGLSGELIRPYAKTLVGVDLSEKMLDEAATKNCYTNLVKSDFVEFLEKSNDQYDLVLAGDALVYLSDLRKTFENVKRILHPEGLFIFNIEKSPGHDEVTPVSGRFAHHADYVNKLISADRFALVASREVPIRIQDGKPVTGIVYLVKKVH